VLVPVKAFSQAKMRLAPVLSVAERAALARRLAERVVSAARPLPVTVVCDDPGVAMWALDLGAKVLREPGLGLNAAVTAAVAQLASEGYERVVVAHGDLPLATNLAWLACEDGIVLVPDRRNDGTNVISLPARCGFKFSYGPGSFARHQDEAQRSGLPWRAVHDDTLAWDVDVPDDMAALAP
jgi:2-phospho-L-lactate guanylyltransferase